DGGIAAVRPAQRGRPAEPRLSAGCPAADRRSTAVGLRRADERERRWRPSPDRHRRPRAGQVLAGAALSRGACAGASLPGSAGLLSAWPEVFCSAALASATFLSRAARLFWGVWFWVAAVWVNYFSMKERRRIAPRPSYGARIPEYKYLKRNRNLYFLRRNAGCAGDPSAGCQPCASFMSRCICLA